MANLDKFCFRFESKHFLNDLVRFQKLENSLHETTTFKKSIQRKVVKIRSSNLNLKIFIKISLNSESFLSSVKLENLKSRICLGE